MTTNSNRCSLFQTLWEPSLNRKYFRALTLGESTWNNRVLDPLAFLHLDNWQWMNDPCLEQITFIFIFSRLIKKEPSITMDIEWTKPVETYGALKGNRVRYGRRGGKLTEILITDPDVQHQEISDLEKGIEYEFRVSGINLVGAGEETFFFSGWLSGLNFLLFSWLSGLNILLFSWLLYLTYFW